MGKKIIVLLLILITSSLWAERPFSNIKDVENGELEKIKRKIYSLKLKSLENDESEELAKDEISYNEYPSYKELEINLLKASIKRIELIELKKQFIEKLKKSLRSKLWIL